MAAVFGAIFEIEMGFYIIALCVAMFVLLQCRSDSKSAKKTKFAAPYLVLVLIYNVFWVMTLQEAKYEGRLKVYELHGGEVQSSLYFALCVIALVDLWLLRRWFIKLGRGCCVS